MVKKHTADNKRVKSFLIAFASEKILAGENRMAATTPLFRAPDDIRVVGWEMESWAFPDTDLDSGHVTVDCRLGRGPAGQYTAWLGHCHSSIQVHDAVVGINQTQNTLHYTDSEQDKHQFPEGMGVDMDEDETLELSVHGENTMANAHWMKATAVVFYVER